MGYAFISYSTKNQKEADAMRDLFRKNGIDTWMAPYDIPVGSRYAQVVNQALKNCACLVLMLTDDAQKSIWVGKEVERAVSCRKTILPLQLEDIKLNDEFELYTFHSSKLIPKSPNCVSTLGVDICELVCFVRDVVPMLLPMFFRLDNPADLLIVLSNWV